MQLLEVSETTDTPDRFLAKVGEIFATFDERTQDSGNVSYGVQSEEGRFFVKTAGVPSNQAFLSHEARVFWLRNAARLSAALQDPALCRLRNVVESPHGPMLIYDWASGELIGTPRIKRADPASPFMRFKSLPLRELITALTAVFRVHAALCAQGWVANDFYDGAMMYDFKLRQIKLVDLDMYREGPFVNDMGRMFGSTRFMAPEEFERGAIIDELTTVFTMGQCISVFLADRDEPDNRNLLSDILSIAERACQEERTARWGSMREFFNAWLLISSGR